MAAMRGKLLKFLELYCSRCIAYCCTNIRIIILLWSYPAHRATNPVYFRCKVRTATSEGCSKGYYTAAAADTEQVFSRFEISWL